MQQTILDEVHRLFREFVNRLDEMIVFRPLTRKDMLKIVDIMLSVRQRLAERGRTDPEREVRDLILERGYQPKFGRPCGGRSRPDRRSAGGLSSGAGQYPAGGGGGLPRGRRSGLQDPRGKDHQASV